MKRLHLTIAAVMIGIHFILSLIFVLIPGSILRFLGMKKSMDRYIIYNGKLIAKGIIFFLGGSVNVVGKEHLPSDDTRICFVSNHRSQIDIPLIVGYIPMKLGFIAKKELRKVPILRTWMDALGCVYIDRTNPRSQIKAIIDGAKAIAAGHPQVIFPEGTRSKSETFGTFKSGSVKLGTRAKGLIIPLTIKDTSYLFESKQGIGGYDVTLIIHPAIDTAELQDDELKELPEKIFSIIREEV